MKYVITAIFLVVRPLSIYSWSLTMSANGASEQGRSRLVDLLPPIDTTNGAVTRMFLIRHGETRWNAEGRVQGGGYDLELNDDGLRQADATAEELRDVGTFDILASSHLRRAKQTADAVSRFHPSARRRELSGLGEMRFGKFEGLALQGPNCKKETMYEWLGCMDKMNEDENLRWPGDDGESLADVEKRAMASINSLLNEARTHDGDSGEASKQIGVLAHGRTINILLASMIKNDIRLFSSFKQRNCSINVIDVLCREGQENHEVSHVILGFTGHIDHLEE